MLAGTVVIGVQSMLPVQLLAVVLVRLEVGIGRGRSVRIRCTEGIVVRDLLHLAACIHHLTDTAEVVPVIIVECELIGRRCRNRCLGVAALEEVFINPAVLHIYKDTPFILHYKIFSQEKKVIQKPAPLISGSIPMINFSHTILQPRISFFYLATPIFYYLRNYSVFLLLHILTDNLLYPIRLPHFSYYNQKQLLHYQ